MNTELRAYVDRYVNLLEEAEANRADQKELTTEIKDDGFDPSTVKKLAALVISDKKARKKKAENEQMALYIREADLQLDLGYETTVAEIVAGEIKPSIGGSTPSQPAGNDAPRSSSAAASPLVETETDRAGNDDGAPEGPGGEEPPRPEPDDRAIRPATPTEVEAIQAAIDRHNAGKTTAAPDAPLVLPAFLKRGTPEHEAAIAGDRRGRA